MAEAAPTSFALIGCGKAGLSLSLALKSAGWTVTACASRTPDSASRGAQWLACPVKELPAELDAGVPIMVAVPEDALPSVDRKIGREDRYLRGRVIFHVSGALPARALESCRLGGAKVGSFHPIMTLPDPLAGARKLKQATFALEGRPEAMAVMRAMAQAISGRFFTLSPRGKTLYHASAVTAANFLVALLAESQELLAHAGADPSTAFPAFQTLVQGTIENVYATGPVQAMTGPIERGDAGTVQAHLQALKRWPKRREFYRTLALKALELSRKRHPGREPAYDALEKILS